MRLRYRRNEEGNFELDSEQLEYSHAMWRHCLASLDEEDKTGNCVQSSGLRIMKALLYTHGFQTKETGL